MELDGSKFRTLWLTRYHKDRETWDKETKDYGRDEPPVMVWLEEPLFEDGMYISSSKPWRVVPSLSVAAFFGTVPVNSKMKVECHLPTFEEKANEL